MRTFVLGALFVTSSAFADDPAPVPPHPSVELRNPTDRKDHGSVLDRILKWDGKLYEWQRGNFKTRVRKDGRVVFRDHWLPSVAIGGTSNSPDHQVIPGLSEESMARSYPSSMVGGAISGSFDLTDMVMRLRGEDPYAPQKRAFMADSREHRWRMALRDRRARVIEALRELPSALFIVWHDPERSVESEKRTGGTNTWRSTRLLASWSSGR